MRESAGARASDRPSLLCSALLLLVLCCALLRSALLCAGSPGAEIRQPIAFRLSTSLRCLCCGCSGDDERPPLDQSQPPQGVVLACANFGVLYAVRPSYRSRGDSIQQSRRCIGLSARGRGTQQREIYGRPSLAAFPMQHLVGRGSVLLFIPPINLALQEPLAFGPPACPFLSDRGAYRARSTSGTSR